MAHYCCHKTWTPAIASTQIIDTVKWFSHKYKIPIATRDQIIIVVTNDLITFLLIKHNDSLLLSVDTNTQIHLLDLAATFHKLLLPEMEIIDDSSIKI